MKIIMDSKNQEILEEAKELFNSSAEVMKQMDRNVLQELRRSGETAVSKLTLLKESSDVASLLVNFRQFGTELLTFLEHGVTRYQETKWSAQRQSVLTHADCLRTILPNLMEIMREVLRTKQDQQVLALRDTFFSIAERSINGIISSYKYLGQPGESEDGLFITKMDQTFRLLDGSERPSKEELEDLIQWILRHSLAVAKGTNQQDEQEITTVCQKILLELNNFKHSAREECLEMLGGSLELLEQNVNGALLRLAISALTSLDRPLDNLLAAALGSETEVKERISDDLSEEVQRLDTQSDHLFQLSHFCLYCTADQEKAQALRSSGRLLESLEAELVPSVLQLYLSPSPGARVVARLVRQSWRSLLEQVQTLVLGIVDPTAYCIILLQELETIARRLKTDLYSQDPRPLQESVERLLSMAETGVDLAWRELGDKSLAPLPETHHLVTAERSIWEVRAASKLLVKTIQDLSLHQSLLKRVQVLVGSFQGLVTLLTEKTEEEEEAAGSVLFPSLLARTESVANTRNSTNFLSFRSKKNLDKTALLAGELRKEMYKITVDLTPFTPRPEAVPRRPTLTRKPSKVTVNGCLLQTPIRRSQEGSRIVRRSSARLSSVISELSVLSHELSVCLEDQEVGQENVKEEEEDKLQERHQNRSLRRVALKNISNKVTLTSASNIAI